ncbi:MAG: Ig-like domain repeat protein [Nocardioides sp.]|uniref:Ig-like domain repeat protein n=1 Tax=Nocardioides sp. TaxID=35761 RepID=UPI003F0AB4DC
MNSNVRAIATAITATLGLSLLAAAPAVAAPTAAAPKAKAVDIRVELNLPHFRTGQPAVFVREDVVPGAGVELTAADLVDNPNGWSGSLDIDIDPTTQRIVISGEDDGADFETAVVTIANTYLAAPKVINDALPEEPALMERAVKATAKALTFTWTSTKDPSDSVNLTGKATFSYKVRTSTRFRSTSVKGNRVASSVVVKSLIGKPAGKVVFTLKRGGKKIATKKVSVNRKGLATVSLPTRGKGSYTLVAAYKGSKKHAAGKATRTLRVR